MIMPLSWLFHSFKLSHLFYSIKCYRIFRGFRSFDLRAILNSFKNVAKEIIEKKIKDDPKIGDETIADYNNIENCLLTNYSLQIFKLVITILNISYFVGMIWLTFCVLINTVDGLDNGNNFLEYFGLSELLKESDRKSAEI